MKTKKPSKRKIEILILLYRFRFLNTNQIQKLLHHKNPTRIQTWLQELTTEGYIVSDYNRNAFVDNTKPAIYCLAKKSIKTLRDIQEYSSHRFTRIYKEKKLSTIFKNKHILIADISILFLTEKGTTPKKHFATSIDLKAYDYFPNPLPDAYLAIKDDQKTRRYFLSVFDENMKRYKMKVRVKQYFRYAADGDWQAHTNESLPMILLICPDDRRKNMLKKFILEQLEKSYEEITYFLTTMEVVNKVGLKSSIWEKVNILAD